MLEAIGDKKHERHVEIREWLGDDFNSQALDPESLKADVAALAKRWSRNPTVKKPRPDRPARLTGSLGRDGRLSRGCRLMACP